MNYIDPNVINDEIELDDASGVLYEINITTHNRALTSAERRAIRSLVQNTINSLSVKLALISARSPDLVKFCCHVKSSIAGTYELYPETESDRED